MTLPGPDDDDSAPREASTSLAPATQRLDKWLWFVRVLKTRTQSATLVTEGKVRLNRQKVDKPSQLVRAGDILTITIGSRVRILEVVAPGTRRGSATEAAALMKDLSPPPPPRGAEAEPAPSGSRDAGSGRPTKRDRRQIDRLQGHQDD